MFSLVLLTLAQSLLLFFSVLIRPHQLHVPTQHAGAHPTTPLCSCLLGVTLHRKLTLFFALSHRFFSLQHWPKQALGFGVEFDLFSCYPIYAPQNWSDEHYGFITHPNLRARGNRATKTARTHSAVSQSTTCEFRDATSYFANIWIRAVWRKPYRIYPTFNFFSSIKRWAPNLIAPPFQNISLSLEKKNKDHLVWTPILQPILLQLSTANPKSSTNSFCLKLRTQH